MVSLIKKPSAWAPIVLSLAALAVMLFSFSIFGVPQRQGDEGTGAHLFQIWLALEFLMIAFFAIKWLPRNPRPVLLVLALQILAVLAACAPVFYLGL